MLVDPSIFFEPSAGIFRDGGGIESLFRARDKAIQTIVKTSRPYAIWGAAGKGIVLAHALRAGGAEKLVAVDADHHRWNKFLEVSGVEVFSPERALRELSSDYSILVSNPNHLEEVRGYVKSSFQVQLPRDFIN